MVSVTYDGFPAADLVRPLVDAWERRRRHGALAATSATAATSPPCATRTSGT
ncbi:hypothetical protein ABZ553_02485 [Streptomyces sparsogenes]|uniref:hypothetical protein n=1 Tax=Streptomyces sparsogenes TaxID=67365 RepID=UPI0033E68BE0